VQKASHSPYNDGPMPRTAHQAGRKLADVMPGAALFLCLALLVAAGTPAQKPTSAASPAKGSSPSFPWLDVKGAPLPFESDRELLEFLKKAKIKEVKPISTGITGPLRLVLEMDGIRAHAHFNHVEQEKPIATLAGGKREVGFRDSHHFQGAAYELAVLLDLDNVPPSVERFVQGQNGTVTAWVENAITEKDRYQKKLIPPNPQRWNRQKQNMHVWDNLIYNIDRNQGNILIDANWKLWMIDHTRSFRRTDSLQDPPGFELCGRRLFEALRNLKEKDVRQRLRPYLRGFEIEALLKRRVKLIAHIEQLIRERGEAAVLFAEDF
jgi:hypothetical protein